MAESQLDEDIPAVTIRCGGTVLVLRADDEGWHPHPHIPELQLPLDHTVPLGRLLAAHLKPSA